MQTGLFVHETTIRLAHTDAAGLLFFPNQFLLAHEAYEEWLTAAGFSLAMALRSGELLLPIVHCEADYTLPVFVGDRVTVMLSSPAQSQHSFTLGYRFVRGADEVGSARTVHVSIARTSGQKVPLPPALLRALSQITPPG